MDTREAPEVESLARELFDEHPLTACTTWYRLPEFTREEFRATARRRLWDKHRRQAADADRHATPAAEGAEAIGGGERR